MIAPLYMVELRLDAAALLRFAEDRGLNTHKDEDLGYATHAWLMDMFGDLAPKPFRLLQDRRNLKPPRLLGLTEHDGVRLTEQAQTFASPLATQVCPLTDGIAAKAMPEAWSDGRRLGFEAVVCPISRLGRNEDDVYRRHVRQSEEQGSKPGERTTIYRQWLAKQLEPAADLENFSLDGFRNLRLLRKAGDQRSSFLAPQALVGGTLNIRDGKAFGEMLARGIGRHRAFGFGMLLLRPAS